MVEIWTESAKFDTSQRLADQTRLILRKGWLFWPWDTSCGQVNFEEHAQWELPKRIGTQNIENQITTEPSTKS